MSRIVLAALLGLVVSVTLVSGSAAQNPAAKTGTEKSAKNAAEAPLDQESLERAFAEKLSGAVFAGSYSVTQGGEEKPAQMEKYTIAKVSKVKDDYWLFSARIQYGKNDVTVPMTLQVKWAGDTPVITLTDLTIPGLGTFTSRVMIYGDRYAGTWQHDKTGGHLWGRIEKPATKEGGDKPSNGKSGNGQ